VVIGLIGGGQEIHVGEEAGLVQWRHAIEGSRGPGDWHVHLPDQAADVFADSPTSVEIAPALSLDTEIRFHLATDIHKFVAGLLEDGAATRCAAVAGRLESQGYHLRITRSLEQATDYLRERYPLPRGPAGEVRPLWPPPRTRNSNGGESPTAFRRRSR